MKKLQKLLAQVLAIVQLMCIIAGAASAEYGMEKQQYFIFIAKRGIINQEIDLRGFKILGGSFLFNFSPGDLPASIISGLNVGIPVSAQLPEIVNGYKLYHGPVKHNTIQLIFQ